MNRFMMFTNRLMFESYHLFLSRIIKLSESIQINPESIQTFIWAAWIISHFTWLASIFSIFLYVWAYPSWCLNRFTQLFLCENLALLASPIYCLLPLTPKSLNHLQLFSLGLKNSLFILSSRLNTFFLESLCSLSL